MFFAGNKFTVWGGTLHSASFSVSLSGFSVEFKILADLITSHPWVSKPMQISQFYVLIISYHTKSLLSDC